MSKYQFTLSRKVYQSIRSGLESLRSNVFTEQDVKTLLIDVRELAKDMRDQLRDKSNQFTKTNRDFIDVCDFIAHASRDRGIIETNIRKHVRKIHSWLELQADSKKENPPVEDYINANTLVDTLTGVAYHGLSTYDKSLTSEYFLPLHEHQSDIALCILSLLQDSTIELEKNEGSAILHLLPHEGFYRLYCHVIRTKIENKMREMTGGAGQVHIGFPIMISTAKCIDQLPFEINSESTLRPILETYRDNESTLRLRVVQGIVNA